MGAGVPAMDSRTRLGRMARWPLRLLPGDLVVPVLRGPLRGARWVVGAATHGCWLGTYEGAVHSAFVGEARRARVVYDVGANVGFYTLMAARHIPEGGRVIAFEPVNRNVSFLMRHLRLNELSNVEVRCVALADVSGRTSFMTGSSALEGRLDSEGASMVEVTTLDELTASAQVPDPDFVKIDVEGAELRVLNGGQATITRARPAILLATHGSELDCECRNFLSARDYALDPLAHDTLLARPVAAGKR